MNTDETRLDVLERDGIRLVVARRGAEMISLARQRGDAWEGFLHRDGITGAPETGWANHATVMGYFLHRLWNQESNYKGHTIRGGNHGFLRAFDFDAPVVTEDSLTYHVAVDEIPPEAYPFRLEMHLSYRLAKGVVEVAFEFLNHESFDVHASFGLHPGFSVGELASACVEFPPGRYVRHMAPGNFLDGRTEVLDFVGGEMPYAKDALPDSYLIELGGVPQPRFTLSAPSVGREVVLDFRDVPYATFWSGGPDYLCIEPCWGLPDANPPTPFESKPGIQTIPAGSVLRRAFSIEPRFIP